MSPHPASADASATVGDVAQRRHHLCELPGRREMMLSAPRRFARPALRSKEPKGSVAYFHPEPVNGFVGPMMLERTLGICSRGLTELA